METIRSKLDRLRSRSARGEAVRVDASALLRFADGGIHFLLAAVLAGAVIFESCAPFGLALVGRRAPACAARPPWWGPASDIWRCWGFRTACGMCPPAC